MFHTFIFNTGQNIAGYVILIISASTEENKIKLYVCLMDFSQFISNPIFICVRTLFIWKYKNDEIETNQILVTYEEEGRKND